MPSQAVLLYEGSERERERQRQRDRLRQTDRQTDRDRERGVMQINTGEWLGRQRSAARSEPKTKALWGEFLQ